MSGLVASPSSFNLNLNLSDYVDTSTQPNTQLSLATRSTASEQRALLPNSTINCNNKLKRIVPVTTLRNMNLALNFESIRCYFVWKYSFDIFFESIRLLFFWKYSFDILFYNDSRCHCDICYYGHSELWTMNCSKLSFELWYELLWGVQEVNVSVSVSWMMEIKNYKMKHLVCNLNRCICKYQCSKLMLWWLVRY